MVDTETKVIPSIRFLISPGAPAISALWGCMSAASWWCWDQQLIFSETKHEIINVPLFCFRMSHQLRVCQVFQLSELT